LRLRRWRMQFVLPIVIGILFANGLGLAQPVPADVQAKIVPIFQAARAAEGARNFEKAAALYDDVLRLAPAIAEIWTNKGLALHELGRYRDSLAAFEKARSLNPRLVVPHLFIGVEQMNLGRARDAIVPIEKALELDPGNTKATYELARAYMQVDSYDRAVSLLSSLIESNPDTDDVSFTLGLAYLNWSRNSAQKLATGNSPYGALVKADAEAIAGFPDPAGDKYRGAVARLSPSERAELPVDPSIFRASAGGRQTDTDAKDWTGLEREEPDLDSAAARAWKAGRYYRALHAARFRLKQAADPRAMYWLSLTCRALARESLLRAVERYPDSARAHLIVAEMARDDGDQERALTELEKAVTADPRNSGVRLLYLQHLASVRSDGMLPKAREAAAVFPNNVAIKCELGRALLKANEPDEALTVFRTAAAADPKAVNVHVGLADALAALGNFEAAITEVRPVLASDPDGSYHYRIGRWYQKTGRKEEARAAFAETSRIKAKTVADLEQRLTGTMQR
jgi:tetratricopeptide (TPR) repeat protein